MGGRKRGRGRDGDRRAEGLSVSVWLSVCLSVCFFLSVCLSQAYSLSLSLSLSLSCLLSLSLSQAYDVHARAHGIAATLVVATGDDNNPFVSAAAKEFGWVRPLVAFDPAQLSVRALEETLASVPRVAGVSLRGGDAAELLAVDPAVWRWLDARKWLISQNNRGEGWLAWLPVLQRTPGLRLLVAHCGLPLQAPPSERENPAPREVLHERLKTVLALAE